MNTIKQREGFALPAAVGSLVVVGALVTAGFFIAQQELRIGVASKFSAMAVNLAQSAANDVLVNEVANLTALSTWDTVTMVDTVDGGITSVQATRLASRLYFLDATARVTEGGTRWGGASRRVGVVARLATADVFPPAALTTQGSLKFGGSSQIHGLDGPPDGSDGADWTSICDTTNLQDSPGILIDDTTNINWNGNRSKIEGDMTGDPKFDQDVTLTAEKLMNFGDLTWNDMVSLAEKVYYSSPPKTGSVVTGGICDQSNPANWGEPSDPASPCFNYFPIIYLAGSGTTNLSGGYGQGILLVENDLKVTGGFEFYGPVFVKGTLTTMGSGGHFWGGVVAASADLSVSTVLGDAVVNFSSCAVERAVLNNASLTRVRPLAMRSWVDLSAVTGGS